MLFFYFNVFRSLTYRNWSIVAKVLHCTQLSMFLLIKKIVMYSKFPRQWIRGPRWVRTIDLLIMSQLLLTYWAIGPNNLNLFKLWSLTTIKIDLYSPSNIYLKSKFRMEEHSIVTIYLNFRAVRLSYTYSIWLSHILPISYVQIHSVSRVTCKFVKFTRPDFLPSYTLSFFQYFKLFNPCEILFNVIWDYHKNHKTIKFDLKQKN